MNAKTKKKTASISVPADVLAAAQCLIYEFLSNDFDDRMKEFRDTGLCRASGTGADELEAAAECYERWRLIREAKLESKAGLTSLKQWRLNRLKQSAPRKSKSTARDGLRALKETEMNDGTLIYVLTTRVGDEDAQVWTYSTRDAAEQAIRLVAEREHGDLVTGLAAPPTAIDDCITMLVRDCGYRDVRLTQTELGLDPGDYDPEDLYLPPELIPA